MLATHTRDNTSIKVEQQYRATSRNSGGCATLTYATPQLHLHQLVVCAQAIACPAMLLAQQMTCSRTGELPRGTRHDAIKADSPSGGMQLRPQPTRKLTPTRLSACIKYQHAITLQPPSSSRNSDYTSQSPDNIFRGLNVLAEADARSVITRPGENEHL